jgi:S-layer protein (TIGR01567 family)
MVITNTIKGIAFVVLMLSAVLMVMAAAPTINFNEPPTPSNGATVNVNYVNISVTLGESGTALLKWGTDANVSMIGSGTSFYYNKTGLSDGTYTYIVYANDTTPGNWTVSTPTPRTVIVSTASPSYSAPNVINPAAINIIDSSADISFSLNQSDARTIVYYGATVSLGSSSSWNNNSGLSRTVHISGLTGGTTYYYSVYAHNGSNQTYFSNSTIQSFTTSNPTAPNITNVATDTPTASSVNISFSLNQSDARTVVYYGATVSLGSSSNWNNNSGLSRTIQISGLTIGTTYYYSVYAYNGSNQTYLSNSTIQSFTTINPTAPNITNVATGTPTASSVNISFSLNQSDAKTRVFYGTDTTIGTWSNWNNNFGSSRAIMISGLTNGTTYYYSVYAYNGSNQSYYFNSTKSNFTTTYPVPNILSTSPNSPWTTIGRDAVNFTVTFNQIVNVSWLMNGATVASSNSVTSSYLNPAPSTGTWNVTVIGSNINGTVSYSWNWTVRPRSYATGNRIWDGGKQDQFSLTYTWNPMSFPGFYYDIKNDVGNESIKITLNGYTSRTVSKGNIVYTTTPDTVNFGYSGFGSYQVIGFMADKYFAGYTANSKPPNPTTSVGAKSALASGQLHKVLIDDDTKRTVSVGSTLTLQEGYVLKAKDISIADRIMLISLLKDGNEVDTATLQAGQTYVYAPSKVGVVSDLPIIMTRFDSVFSGREVQAAFLKGLFQISANPTTVKSGDQFKDMKVRSVGQDKIEMSTDSDISLSKGNTEELMGDIKILVADNDTLRFALSVEKAGTFEVRSTVYRGNDTNPVDQWNPYNFGMNIGKTSVGFYYNLDDGIGNESLRLAAPLNGSRTISAQNLVYTTTPETVSFDYSGFGSYQVIGFMAEKYFAGYTSSSIPSTVKPTITVGAKSAIGSGQLHKVLIDDDTKRTISVGGTLTLQEGYVLKAKDISVADRIMLISLLKDGNEVDTATLEAGQTYVYAPSKVGVVSDLPIIIARFDSVFSGREVQAAFLRGLFQISQTPTTVKTGDQFKDMKVRSVGQDKIEMSNEGAISLDKNRIEELMGNIKLKVGDTTDNSLRFYFAVDVTPEMVANQLVIDAPAKATAGDPINVKVTAGGKAVDSASVLIGSSEIGKTDANGLLNYTLPRTMKGVQNITATKLGYQQTTRSIEILEYVDLRLSIDAPAKANQFGTITIKVTYNSTPMSGAAVSYDNATIGTTDSNGVLNYTLQTSGTHTISASKSGYITAARDIEVRPPFSEYRALNINITPSSAFTNENVLIRSNITNVGTKADTLPVELISNGTVVDNRSVSLAPGEIKEINFTRKEALPGNYTVEILGQKGLLEVKEAPLNLLLIGGIATGLGAIVIYLLTAKSKISLEMLRQKLLGKFVKKGAEKVTLPEEGKNK